MGCPKKTFAVLFLAGAQNVANSFNFQICQLEQDQVENEDPACIEI